MAAILGQGVGRVRNGSDGLFILQKPAREGFTFHNILIV